MYTRYIENLQQVSNGGNVNGFHVVQFEFDDDDISVTSCFLVSTFEIVSF